MGVVLKLKHAKISYVGFWPDMQKFAPTEISRYMVIAFSVTLLFGDFSLYFSTWSRSWTDSLNAVCYGFQVYTMHFLIKFTVHTLTR